MLARPLAGGRIGRGACAPLRLSTIMPLGVAEASRQAAGASRGVVRLRWAFGALCWLAVAHPGYGRRRDGQRIASPRLGEAEAETLLELCGAVQVDREDAHALLTLANQERVRLQYSNATRLYRLSAAAHLTPLPVPSLPLLVEAGRGLYECGEVKLAGQVLKYSVQAAPPRRKQSTESSQALSSALATLARASVSDGTQSTEAKVAAIEAAAKAQPPPDLSWCMWAVNSLKFVLGDSSRAAAVLEKGILDADVGSLDFTLPSLAQKLRWLVRRLRKAASQRPSASSSLAAIEARLREEHPLWLELTTSSAASVDAPIGSDSDVWRALDASATPPAPFFQHSAALSSSGDSNSIQVAVDGRPGRMLTLTPITTSPAGYIVDSFASAEECAAIAKLARGHLKRSTVGRSQADGIRTSSSAECKPPPQSTSSSS